MGRHVLRNTIVATVTFPTEPRRFDHVAGKVGLVMRHASV
jgi:hypothetical protein